MNEVYKLVFQKETTKKITEKTGYCKKFTVTTHIPKK